MQNRQMKQTAHNLNMILQVEYYRRIDSLRLDGYRLAFDTSHNRTACPWSSYLVHHNGTRIRLMFDPTSNHLVQKTNGIVVYDSAKQTMCKP